MKICIVSDSHDRSDALAAAISDARTAGAQVVIHCGDLIGANTLRASLKLGLPIHAVHGNNLGDIPALYRMMAGNPGMFTYHGAEAVLELAGRKILVTHMPHHGRAFACTGDYDLVCHGHSHTAHVGKQKHIGDGESWLVNPGSVAGIDAPGVKAVPSWVLADLSTMTFDIRTLTVLSDLKEIGCKSGLATASAASSHAAPAFPEPDKARKLKDFAVT